MLDFTTVEKNHELANRLAETFRRQTKKKAAKALFMGVSPLALAACGGGSDSSVAQTLVSGTDGNDTFANSAANERFEGGLGDDTYTVGLTGIDTVFDAGGNDTIKFIWRDARDLLVENVYSNENDLIVEMVGASNTMNIEGAFAPASRIENVNYYNATGEWGEGFVAKLFKFGEAVEGEGGGHLIVGTNSDDTVAITDGDTDEISLWGANGDDNLTTGSGVQYIWGGNGNDIVDSGSGNDTIWGDDGDDIIYAGDGDDTVYGGAGDDIIYATNGGDFEDGGEGNDTMVILGDNAPAEFIINLETETGGIPGGASFENTFANFESLQIGYEWPTGSYVGNNTNWDITGTTGDNVLETSEGDDLIRGLSGNDTLIGNGGDDVLLGGDGDDTLSGGGGDDQLDGGAGNDVFWLSLGTDNYIGGDGVDTFNIDGEADEQFPGDLSITLSFSEGVGSITGGPTLLTFSEVENLRAGYDYDDVYIGSTWSYIITGSEDSNMLETAEGNDSIIGGDGDDTIIANGGDDVLDGGAGDDNVYAGDGNDTVYGSPGADIEDGGNGIDTIIYSDWLGNWSGTFNLATGDNFVSGGSPSDGHKILNFENVRTEHTGDMTIIGTDGDNIIETGAGDDTITGGDGADIIYAGDGDDKIDAGAGDDFIVASRGADFEDGGDGSDTMMWYDPDVASVTIDLSIQGGGLTGGELTSGLFASIENVMAGYSYKTFEYVGNDTIWTIIGSSDANRIETSEADDTLEGGDGSDTLIGNGGADSFVFKIGETGTDTITDFDLAEGDKLDLSSYGVTTEEAAEALMSDSSDGVDVTIDGSVIVTMTATTVADFAAADGWLA